MTISRANAEALLIARVGALFTAVSLDGTTIDGTNSDLNGPIGWAIRQIGQSVDSPIAVDDDDLARVGDSYLDQFLDLAELRCLETAHSSAITLVDITAGPNREALGQLAQRLEERIKTKREQIERDYGIGSGLEAGYITMGFAEHETT